MTDKEFKFSVSKEIEQMDYINKTSKADKAIRFLNNVLKVGVVVFAVLLAYVAGGLV